MLKEAEVGNQCHDSSPEEARPVVPSKLCHEKAAMLGQEMEEMHEALEERGISDVLVKVWIEREVRVLSGDTCEGFEEEESIHSLGQDLRGRALWFMAHLVKILGLPEKSWFDAVALFDAYCIRNKNPIDIGDLPTLCGAVARLVKKMDSSSFLPNECELWACTMQMAQCLRQAGHNVGHPAVTRPKLKTFEEAVLQALNCKSMCPVSIHGCLYTVRG
jgi:hypothetical protein